MSGKFLLVIVILVFVSSSLYSQKLKGYAKTGSIELGGTVSFSSTTFVHSNSSSDALTDFKLAATIGFFPANSFEVTLQPGIEIQSQGSGSLTLLNLYLSPAYVFNLKSNVYPYLGGSAGYTSASSSGSSSNGFSWGAFGGVKVNIAGNSLLNFAITYYQETYNSSADTQRNGRNILSLGAGWSVFF